MRTNAGRPLFHAWEAPANPGGTAKKLAEKGAISLSFLCPLKQLLSKFMIIKYLQHARFAVQFHPKYDDATDKR